jgi:erythronate-4-phosphate dehydrogenase
MAERSHRKVVMDVWEQEPAVRKELVEQVSIATPHIAGYSQNGKRNGTTAVYDGFCQYFNLAGDDTGREQVSRHLDLSGTRDESGFLNQAILQAYPIVADFLDPGQLDLAGHFELRRNTYAFRQEFSDYGFGADSLPIALAADLSLLGFRRL